MNTGDNSPRGRISTGATFENLFDQVENFKCKSGNDTDASDAKVYEEFRKETHRIISSIENLLCPSSNLEGDKPTTTSMVKYEKGNPDNMPAYSFRDRNMLLFTGILLFTSIGFVLTCFFGALLEADSDEQVIKILAYGVGYSFSGICIFYLEGGQALRFMAFHLPPHKRDALGKSRKLIEGDLKDTKDFRIYVGVRQFLTLGTTSANALIINGLAANWSVINDEGTGSDSKYFSVLLTFSHLIALSCLCQLVPQLRAESDIGYGNTFGVYLSYRMATIVGKFFDPSPLGRELALILGRMKGGCCTYSKKDQMITFSEENDHRRNKFHNPMEIAEKLQQEEVNHILKSDNTTSDIQRFMKNMSNPNLDEHVPPHIWLTIRILLEKGWKKSFKLFEQDDIGHREYLLMKLMMEFLDKIIIEQ